MKQIKAKNMTIENFCKYGDFVNLLDETEVAKRAVFSDGFAPDVISLDFSVTASPSISLCTVKKSEQNIITFIEAHRNTCEGIFPIDGDVIIYVCAPDFDGFHEEKTEAFYVPKGTFVKINPLIGHGTQYPVDSKEVHLICMLPLRTFHNDTIDKPLNISQHIEIIM